MLITHIIPVSKLLSDYISHTVSFTSEFRGHFTDMFDFILFLSKEATESRQFTLVFNNLSLVWVYHEMKQLSIQLKDDTSYI